jgi:hypothetical protein
MERTPRGRLSSYGSWGLVRVDVWNFVEECEVLRTGEEVESMGDGRMLKSKVLAKVLSVVGVAVVMSATRAVPVPEPAVP